MAQPLPSYLRRERRKWALTQRELAALLGDVTPSAISKYETLARTPSLEVMLGLEIVFAQPTHGLLPAMSHALSRTVRDNAAALREQLAGKTDQRSAKKRRLLDDLLIRLTDSHEPTP